MSGNDQLEVEIMSVNDQLVVDMKDQLIGDINKKLVGILYTDQKLQEFHLSVEKTNWAFFLTPSEALTFLLLWHSYTVREELVSPA